MASTTKKKGFVIWHKGQTKVMRGLLDRRPANVDVFREILTYLYPSGEAFPSLQSLSDGTGHSLRTVKRAIVSIRKSGLLDEKGTNDRSSVWRLSEMGRLLIER